MRWAWMIFVLSLGQLVTMSSADAVGRSASRTLDNGQVHLTFAGDFGSFEAEVPGGSVHLRAAGPALMVNGHELTPALAKVGTTSRKPFADKLGSGQSLVVQYVFPGRLPSVRYEIRLYDGHPWLSARLHMDGGDYQLGEVSVLRAQLVLPDAFDSRVYYTSGVAGGGTGVWPLGMRRWSSDTLSSWYSPARHEQLSAGFYSFARASSSVHSQYQGRAEVAVDAIVHFNDYRPGSRPVDSEELLINFGKDPLRALEEWVDAAVQMVQPKFIDDVRTSVDNTWYAIGDKASESFGLSQATILRETPLYGYGVNFFELGEWQLQRNAPGDLGNALGFGESEVDKSLYPHGVAWLCEHYKALGFGCSFGANYAYAALATSTAAARPPWLNTSDLAKVDFGYPIDFTHPGAQQWLYDLYKTGGEIGAKWIWSDFDGGPKQGAPYDPGKIRGFEDIREGIRTIRRAVGPDAILHRFCCGPYYTYLGLVDRVRTGDDVRGIGDWLGLQEVSRQLAASYMLHRRFWINDPDPLLVGAREYVHNYGAGPIQPDPAILDEVHMRMMLHASTGSFLTIGENLEDFTAEKLRLFTQVLPTYGAAARPLDLFVHSSPEIFDLPVTTDWERWHVLMLQNWNEADKVYDVKFEDLGLDSRKTYLVMRFWDQAFLGEYSSNAPLRVRRHSGEAFAIRALADHPQILGTDMHLTQGAVELRDVKYSAADGTLSGTAYRHHGAKGQVLIYAPAGFSAQTDSTLLPEIQPSGATVLRLPLAFDNDTQAWSVRFNQPKQ